jgi:hypothetical protein
LADFDIKKLKTSELVMLGGAIAVFIGTFLAWFKVEFTSFGLSSGSSSVNGFHYFLQGTIPWLLSVALAAVVIIRTFFPDVKLPDTLGPLTWSQVYLIAAGAAGFLILTRIISVDGPSSIVSRGIGLYLAFLGGVAEAVGAFLKFQANDDAGAAPSGPPTAF